MPAPARAACCSADRLRAPRCRLRAVKLHSSDAEERKRLLNSLADDPGETDVVVTTFEMAKSPNVHAKLAHRTWWRYLVVDEGHALKNDASQVMQQQQHLQHH